MDIEFAVRENTDEAFGYRSPPSVCTFWLEGRCTRNNCRFSHAGTASPSSDCSPNSTLNKGRSESTVITKMSTSNICKQWAKGDCVHGKKCMNLHSWSDGVEIELHEGIPKPVRLVWWTAPPEDFVKINTDGAFNCLENKAAAGGVVRDSKGRFVIGFSGALSNCATVEEVELLAIFIGMEVAISMGYKNLIVESDSKLAIEKINSERIGDQPLSNYYGHLNALALSIRQIGNQAEHVHCNHVFRETNAVADGLAKHGMGFSPAFGIKLFASPPPFILIPMCADEAGLTYIR